MRAKTEAVCQSCGARMPRWVGRCPECLTWGSVVEEVADRPASPSAPACVRPLAEHATVSAERLPTGLADLDLVLGGGLVRGSVVLVAGEPGVGKSTLTLQAALALGRDLDVLLVCAEEAPQQVRARAERIGALPPRLEATGSPDLGAILAAVASGAPEVVVVDSVQTVFDPDIPSAPGSVSQVRECGARLVRSARDRGATIVLVGHVTKEGTVAGPRVLEHLVDVVLSIEGDRTSGVRVLRALKNRFGSTQDVGFFEMLSEGLVPIRDASSYLLADRCAGLAGSALAACLDGRRPFVCEIQALVHPTTVPVPRRTSVGVDPSRLPLLLAVLSRHAGVRFPEADVYVSAVGGIRVAEPATDLPAVLAILSSLYDVALPPDAVAFGEIGLGGEVRQVVGAERRLLEARSAGCGRAFVPYRTTCDIDGIELHRVRHVGDAVGVVTASMVDS